MRFERLQRVVASGCVVLLAACSGAEKADEPRADVRVLADDGPPLGNPRETVSPHELLEGVKPD